MRKKEALFAVISGVVGAVLAMAGGAVLPLGAQNEVRDAEFGTITCRKIYVGDSIVLYDSDKGQVSRWLTRLVPPLPSVG